MTIVVIFSFIAGIVIGFFIASVRFNKAVDDMSNQWVKMFTDYEEHMYSLLEDIKDE